MYRHHPNCRQMTAGASQGLGVGGGGGGVARSRSLAGTGTHSTDQRAGGQPPATPGRYLRNCQWEAPPGVPCSCLWEGVSKGSRDVLGVGRGLQGSRVAVCGKGSRGVPRLCLSNIPYIIRQVY